MHNISLKCPYKVNLFVGKVNLNIILDGTIYADLDVDNFIIP